MIVGNDAVAPEILQAPSPMKFRRLFRSWASVAGLLRRLRVKG
jgi:hypothetical protein